MFKLQLPAHLCQISSSFSACHSSQSDVVSQCLVWHLLIQNKPALLPDQLRGLRMAIQIVLSHCGSQEDAVPHGPQRIVVFMNFSLLYLDILKQYQNCTALDSVIVPLFGAIKASGFLKKKKKRYSLKHYIDSRITQLFFLMLHLSVTVVRL